MIRMILKTTPAWFARWVEDRSWNLRRSWPIEGGRVWLTLAYSDPPKDPRAVTIDGYCLYPDAGGPGGLVWTHLPQLPGLEVVQGYPNERGEKLDLGIRFELERVSPERIEVLCLYNAYVLPIERYLDELLTGLEEVWPEISGAVGKWRETAVGVKEKIEERVFQGSPADAIAVIRSTIGEMDREGKAMKPQQRVQYEGPAERDPNWSSSPFLTARFEPERTFTSYYCRVEARRRPDGTARLSYGCEERRLPGTRMLCWPSVTVC